MVDRSCIRPGDVLLFEKGSSHGTPFGRIVRLITGSRYTHVALVLRGYDNQLWVVEQKAHVKTVPLGKFPLDEKCKVSVWRNKTLWWKPRDIPYHEAMRFIGRPYGIGSILECLAQHTVGLFHKNWKPTPLVMTNPRNHTCSGLVGAIMRKSLFDIPTWCFTPHLLEPDDFACHGFERVG